MATERIAITLYTDPEALGGSNSPASKGEVERYQEILERAIIDIYPQAEVRFVTGGREEYLVNDLEDRLLRDEVNALEERAVEGNYGEWQD